MKKIISILTIAILYCVTVRSQDTIYVYGDGQLLGKYSVENIDSIIFHESEVPQEETIMDYDGNVYSTVTIGTQTWISENLRSRHTANGVPIPQVKETTDWNTLTDMAMGLCWYDNDSASYSMSHGALYTWAAAMGGQTVQSEESPSGVRGVCPTGFHLPSMAEWETLKNYLIDNGYGKEEEINIAKAMAATWGWNSDAGSEANVGYDLESNNSSGFSAVAGGSRYGIGSHSGEFYDIGNSASYWTTTWNQGKDGAIQYTLYNTGAILYKNEATRTSGSSVRCIKD